VWETVSKGVSTLRKGLRSRGKWFEVVMSNDEKVMDKSVSTLFKTVSKGSR
jgi:hypothetical protein